MSLKKVCLFSFAALFLLSATSAFAANPLCPNPLKVGWEPYAPFQIEDAKAVQGTNGIDIELVEAVLKKIDCKVSFDKSPWKRQIANIESGELDIVTSASKTPEREKFALFLAPYMKGGNVMYGLKSEKHKYKFKELKEITDKNKYESPKDFTEFKLGVTRGYEYGDIYAALIKDANFSGLLSESITDQNLLDKAEAKRVGALLGDITVTSYLLKQEKKSHLFTIYPTKVDDESTLYFAYSKKTVSQELANKIDGALKTALKDGTFKNILIKYIPKDNANLIILK